MNAAFALRAFARAAAFGLAACAVGCGAEDPLAGSRQRSQEEEKNCTPDDFDGVNGGKYTFNVVVNDEGFTPQILKTQNESKVTLKVTNEGTTPHSFSIACLPTPNDDGCPQRSCFPDEASFDPVPPGENATTEFESPNPEGIYDFRSDVPGDDGLTGQFIIQ